MGEERVSGSVTGGPPSATANDRNQPRSLGKAAKMSAVWDFSARLSSQWVGFVIAIFLARLLTPADFGVTAAARFFISLASRVTQFGLNASLVRMKEIRSEHLSSVFVANLVTGVAAFLTLYAVSTHMGRFFGSGAVANVLPVSALVFLIVPFGTVAAAMLQRHLRYRTSTVIQWSDSVFSGVASLVLAWFGWGYWSLVIGALVGTVISTTAKLCCSPWRPSLRFSVAAFKETVSFGLGFQAKRLLAFSTTNVDNLVVGRLLGVTSLGFYDKGYGLMSQLTDRMTFDGALMRIFAIINDEPARFRKALLKGVQATSIVTFPILLFAFAAAEHLVITLFGPKWQPAIGPFRVLALVGLVRSAARPINAANESLGLVWLQTALQCFSVTMLVAGIAVGSWWGLTTAACGVLVAAFIDAGLNLWLLTDRTTVTAVDFWHAVWPSLVTACLTALAVSLVNLTLRESRVAAQWVYTIADCVTAALVYPASLLWTPFSSVRKVVQQSVDDVAPWLRRLFPIGLLRYSVDGGAVAPQASRGEAI